MNTDHTFDAIEITFDLRDSASGCTRLEVDAERSDEYEGDVEADEEEERSSETSLLGATQHGCSNW